MNALVFHGNITYRCRYITSILAKVIGLRFSPPLASGEGLLMDFTHDCRVTLDMLFVFFPLDLVWIDSRGIVVKVVRRAWPFIPAIRGPPARYILELRAGDARHLQEGNAVTIKLLKNASS